MVKHVNQNHAVRCFDVQALRDRHPDTSDASPKHVIPTEIAVAYGGRRVRKLVDVLCLPTGSGSAEILPQHERARCMRYLLGVLTDQEAKAEAVGCDVAVPLANTLRGEKESGENKTLACKLLQSLAHSLEGRNSIVAIDAVVAASALLKDDDVNVRIGAGEFLASMAKHNDGAVATLRAAEGNVLVLLANAAVEESPAATCGAKTLCCEILALLTTTDEGTVAALKANTVTAMKKVFQSDSASEIPNGVFLKTAAARCLKNVCQHGVGKIKALEMGVVPLILPLLRSRDTDVRLQATGALACLTIENDAKIEVVNNSARFDLCALLRDSHKSVALNALVTLQQCAEHPSARKLIRECVSKRDHALVFDRRVVGESVVTF